MSVHPTTTTVARGIAVACTTLTALAFCATASATSTGPAPEVVEGNPTCAAAGAEYTELKIDPVPQGKTAFTGDGLSGTIEVDGVHFDWVTSKTITAIVVKGGPDGNVYRFAATRSGYGFHAPINPNTGRPYGLSHISFCAGGPSTTPPPPSGCGTANPPATGCETTPPPSGCGTANPPATGCDTTPPPSGCGTANPPATGCETTPPPSGCGTANPPATGCATTTTPPATQPPGTTPPAVVPPQQEVLGDSDSGGPTKKPRRRPVAAIARLNGPDRCVTGAARVAVRGTGIKKVVFRVNGRKVATVRGSRATYKARIAGARDVLRVTARVTFVAKSRKPARTLRTTVLACRSQSPAVAPHFTG